MAEAYALIEERLHLSVEEQYSLENQIMELKVCDAFTDKVYDFKETYNILWPCRQKYERGNVI